MTTFQSSVCRVCLVKDPSSVMRSLDDQKTRDLLYECTSVLVEPGDEYPQQMCPKCYRRCKSWSDFKDRAQENDRKLKSGEKEVLEEEEYVEMTMIKEEEQQDKVIDEGGMSVIVKEETTMVKEEPMDYLEGYSLAPEDIEGEMVFPEPNSRRNQRRRTSRNEGSASALREFHKCRICPKSFPTLLRREAHERIHMLCDNEPFEGEEQAMIQSPKTEYELCEWFYPSPDGDQEEEATTSERNEIENEAFDRSIRFPDHQIRDRDFSGNSQDPLAVADTLVFTYKTDIKWQKRKSPIVVKEFGGQFQDNRAPTKPGTPFDYFRRYIDDSFYVEAAYYTNLYAEQKKDLQNGVKSENSFAPCNAAELRVLFAHHMVMGALRLPSAATYYKKSMCQTFFDKMGKRRFSELRTHLQLVNVQEKPEEGALLFEVEPLIERVRCRLLKLPLEENLAINQQIIPYKGDFFAKQCITSKESPCGIKVFCLNGQSGQPYDFFIHQGQETTLDQNIVKQFGYPSAVVLKLAERIPGGAGHSLFFDNYFPTFQLFEALKEKNIRAAGTILLSRFGNPRVLDEKMLNAREQGTSTECVSSNEAVILTRWYDTEKVVNLASNFVAVGQVDTDKKKNKVTSDPPEVLKLYNQTMGGVHLMDQLLAYYRINIRTTRWSMRVIMYLIDFALVSSWTEYREDCRRYGKLERETLNSMDFRMEVANTLNHMEVPEFTEACDRPLKRPHVDEEVLGDPLKPLPPQTRQVLPPIYVRKDGLNHWPLFADVTQAMRCMIPGCKEKSYIYCSKCNVHLCTNRRRSCFYDFHVNL